MAAYLWNNVDQLKKIRYRFNSYLPISLLALKKGVSVRRLIYSRFPFQFPQPSQPASISLELTDACDLKCLYCNNPLFANPRTFMSEKIYTHLFERLDEFKKVDRIRVGGGEPTLHPKFRHVSENLAKRTKFLSIVTNAQWKKEHIAETLLMNYDLVEISVDAGGKDVYEASRPGADYDLLIKNLEKLKALKQKLGSKAHINFRFMVRPSNDAGKEKEYAFWKQYADTIMPQYIIQHFETELIPDVYSSVHTSEQRFPKCTLPFKDLQIRSNGNVPICQVSGSTLDPAKKKIIGNVANDSLLQLWRGEAFSTLRMAHKQRNEAGMEICRGCKGI